MNQNIKLLKDQLSIAIEQVTKDLEGFKTRAIGIHIDLASGDIKNSLSFTSEGYEAYVETKKLDLANFENPIEVLIIHADKEGYDIITFDELKPLVITD